MRRRAFITLLGGAAAWPLAVRAQQAAKPIVGYLYSGGPDTGARSMAAFLKGLGELGFSEGHNVSVEYRWSHNDPERLPELAADLVRRRVAVIVAPGTAASVLAAKAATTSIPIVFRTGGDPVELGLVGSLNRPGGNVTGINAMSRETGPKRLGLLHELLPAATRFAVLFNHKDPNAEPGKRDLQGAASSITPHEGPCDLRFWARDEQIAPSGDWATWLYLAGRGAGKTRAGAEWVLDKVRKGTRIIHLVAPTEADYRDVMIHGPAGLVTIAKPKERPRYIKQDRKVLFPNGAYAICFSAEQPERLRGPQCEAAWCDEIAAWRYVDQTWDMMSFGLRLGVHPQVFISTTPGPACEARRSRTRITWNAELAVIAGGWSGRAMERNGHAQVHHRRGPCTRDNRRERSTGFRHNRPDNPAAHTTGTTSSGPNILSEANAKLLLEDNGFQSRIGTQEGQQWYLARQGHEERTVARRQSRPQGNVIAR